MRQSRLQNLYSSAIDKCAMVFFLWQLKKAVISLEEEERGTPSEENNQRERSRGEASYCGTLPDKPESRAIGRGAHSADHGMHGMFIDAPIFSWRRIPFVVCANIFWEPWAFWVCANIFWKARTFLVCTNIFWEVQNFCGLGRPFLGGAILLVCANIFCSANIFLQRKPFSAGQIFSFVIFILF